MVRDFQSIIGCEAHYQIIAAAGRLPDLIIACVGGGSNSIGMFHSFLEYPGIKMRGVEAGGRSITLGNHAARFEGGSRGVLQGSYTYILQNSDGQISSTHSISAGLDYAAIGPEHAMLHDQGRVAYVSIDDEQALDGFQALSKLEGIIPALESAHAIADAMRVAPTMSPDQIILVNLSGRGDKDIFSVADVLGVSL
jgi:tryptophan synthase beta chain